MGRIAEPRRLDQHGYTARLLVETPLRGPLERGAEVRIAWEELAPSRAPRFDEGDRILVSLERLPGASIWLGRLPEPAERAKVLGVAMRGDAFLRRPSLASVTLLQHYLALTREDRDGAVGAGYLVDLAAGAELELARDAVAQLARHARLDEKLGTRSAARLVRALLRPDASPQLQDAVVELIERLVELSGEQAVEPVVPGLSDPEPSVRRAAVRGLGSLGASAVSALRRVVEGDAPEAARSAVAALLEIADTHPDPGLRELAGIALGRPIGHRH